MSKKNKTCLEDHIRSRFNVLKKMGEGAYGHVWQVEDKATHRVMALKKIFDAFQHATDAQRTYREIEILRQTNHPSIIKLLEVIPAQNNQDVYVLFEFVQADLYRVILEGSLLEMHIFYIIHQLASALKYLETGCIIHRDLKPSNILINEKCQIKICDFGLVRSLKTNSNSSPVLTQGVATMWYRAPELLLGSKSYSTPADVWSFGCIIYQMITGKPLFAGNSTSEQIQKICNATGYPSDEDIQSMESEPARFIVNKLHISNNIKPYAFLKDIKPPFDELISRMLTFNPKKRMTIDQILAFPAICDKFKWDSTKVCSRPITTTKDDNKKLSVNEYRELIYGQSHFNKPKALSASMGGTSSLKFIRPSAVSNYYTTTTTMVQKAGEKTQKKYPVEGGFTQVKPQIEVKKEERTTLKVVRSVTDMNMKQLSEHQPGKKLIEHYNQTHNKEEMEVTDSKMLNSEGKISLKKGYPDVRPRFIPVASSTIYPRTEPWKVINQMGGSTKIIRIPKNSFHQPEGRDNPKREL